MKIVFVKGSVVFLAFVLFCAIAPYFQSRFDLQVSFLGATFLIASLAMLFGFVWASRATTSFIGKIAFCAIGFVATWIIGVNVGRITGWLLGVPV